MQRWLLSKLPLVIEFQSRSLPSALVLLVFYMCLTAVAFPIDLNNLVLTKPEAVGIF